MRCNYEVRVEEKYMTWMYGGFECFQDGFNAHQNENAQIQKETEIVQEKIYFCLKVMLIK